MGHKGKKAKLKPNHSDIIILNIKSIISKKHQFSEWVKFLKA